MVKIERSLWNYVEFMERFQNQIMYVLFWKD